MSAMVIFLIPLGPDALCAQWELIDDWQLRYGGKITIMRDHGEAALIQRCRQLYGIR